MGLVFLDFMDRWLNLFFLIIENVSNIVSIYKSSTGSMKSDTWHELFHAN